MNPFKYPFTFVLGLAIAIVGCATTTQTSTQNKESMLVASGFRLQDDHAEDGRAEAKATKPSTRQDRDDYESGETYYVYPDAPNNQAYVGGPAKYQAYQQQRAANKLAEENLETAELYQDEAMNWGGWGGWGAGWGTMGMGVGIGRGRF